MEKSKNMEVNSTKELKPEFTEDRDEAWLDDLLSYLNAVEDWSMENATKGLMVDTMRKLPAQKSQWDEMAFGYSSSRLLDELNSAPGIIIEMRGYAHHNLKPLQVNIPLQEQVEQGIYLDKEKSEMETFRKTAGTQTSRKTTRDAGIQVRMGTALKSSTSSGKHLANCQ